jgi:hypothetical protein
VVVRKDLHHGGNVQILSAADGGWLLWVSDVRPGREHDPTALNSSRASGSNASTVPDLPVLEEWTTDLHEVLFNLGYEKLGT